jgi:PKD domain
VPRFVFGFHPCLCVADARGRAFGHGQGSRVGANGGAVTFQAVAYAQGVPALSYHWDFGDGTSATGAKVRHAFTRPADYNVKLTVKGVDGLPAESGLTVAVRGSLKTAFHLLENRRYVESGNK